MLTFFFTLCDATFWCRVCVCVTHIDVEICTWLLFYHSVIQLENLLVTSE